MKFPELDTAMAPAERADPAALERDARLFGEVPVPLLVTVLDAVPDMVLVLNEQRQIVFANEACLRLFSLGERSTLLGLRPGEMIGCAHAAEPGNGCGTTEFCRTCGAVRAILSSLRGLDSVQECAITLSNGDALDLRVWTRPLRLEGKLYSIFSVQDISHEKRRRAIERIFFHDVLNTAGLLMTGADLLRIAPETTDQIIDQLTSASRRLVDEIQGQRALLEAETGELELQPEPIDALELVHEVCAQHQLQHLTDDRQIRVQANVPNVRFTSDRVLLARVLGNMVKNALEAADSGESVSLGYSVAGDSITFSVHGPAYMPRNVQLQVFYRSFSTKGSGRGLGTYSMKLLTERFLSGQVWFTSTREAGTTFYASYPLVWRALAPAGEA